ncbi:MAG: hypothetical protein RLW42_13545, partial [Gammaproteobacteria bacterium]
MLDRQGTTTHQPGDSRRPGGLPRRSIWRATGPHDKGRAAAMVGRIDGAGGVIGKSDRGFPREHEVD